MSYFSFNEDYSNSIFKEKPKYESSVKIIREPPKTKIVPTDYTTYNNNNGMEIFNLIPGDKVLSPFGIMLMMLIIMNGANDNSLQQLMNIFGIGNLDELKKKLPIYKTILNRINITNGFFIDDKYKIDPKFENVFNNYCGLYNVNFNDAKVYENINKWVMNNSDNLIHQCVSNDIINGYTKMMVINAMYFKGIWKIPFNKKETREMPFYSLNNSNTKKVQMMHQSNLFNYYEDAEEQLIEVDYKNPSYCMGFILSKNGLPKLNGVSIFEHIKDLTTYDVSLYIPKFIQRSKFDFVNLLKIKGIHDIFDNNKANLFNIHMDVNNPLCISNIIHDATVEVDESENINYPYPNLTARHMFKADRPFVYYIRYKPSNLILFIGTYG